MMRAGFLLLLSLVYSVNLVFAQENYDSNGPNNLTPLCRSNDCIYTELSGVISYPLHAPDKHWDLYNMEIVINRSSGKFLATGDLHINKIDTAAVITISVDFFDSEDKLLYSHLVLDIEFYNEPNQAEPILLTGELSENLAQQVEFIAFEIGDSRLMPYYEMKSSCYHACKNHQLNEAIKSFKKSK